MVTASKGASTEEKESQGLQLRAWQEQVLIGCFANEAKGDQSVGAVTVFSEARPIGKSTLVNSILQNSLNIIALHGNIAGLDVLCSEIHKRPTCKSAVIELYRRPTNIELAALNAIAKTARIWIWLFIPSVHYQITDYPSHWWVWSYNPETQLLGLVPRVNHAGTIAMAIAK